MFEIELEEQILAIDPRFEKKVSPPRPAPAPTTDDLNRYTIYVPTDNATLHMGQACDEEQRINDTGIAGRTDTHIHFQVTNETPTIVSLGGPVFKETCDLPPRDDEKVPVESKGYSMVTAGNAWHDAQKQHYLVSQKGDIVVRARATDAAAVLQSDVGSAEVISGGVAAVSAKTSVTISAFKSFEPKNPTYGGDYETPKKASKLWEVYHDYGSCATDAWKYVQAGLIWAYDKRTKATEIKRAKATEVGWEERPEDRFKTVLDWTNAVLGGLAQYEKQGGFGLPTIGLGKINIDADGFVDITASVSAALHGQASVGVSSLLSVEILGGFDTGVTGMLYTNVTAGKKATVSSRKDVAVEAETGDLALRGRKSAELSSEKGPLRLQGNENVMMTSVDKSVYLHGKERVQMTAGAGAGFGVHADGDTMEIGHITSGANKLEPVTMNKKQHISFEKSGAIVTQATNSELALRQNSAKLSTVSGKNMVYVTHQSVKVKANGKILLG